MNGCNKKKNRIGGVIWWISVFICIAMFLGGASCFIRYFKESHEAKELYSYVADIHDSVLEDPEYSLPPQSVTVEDGIQERNFLEECRELYELNSDLVGWICFPNTIINYPVMQTSVDNRDFYLLHDFNKNFSGSGCIYVSEDCDVFTPSDNVTIYGHRMYNGTMFAELAQYEDPSYWVRNQYFTFDTLYEHHTYQVVAVFKTPASGDFRYHMFTNAIDENDFNNFWNEIEERQFYDTGLDVKYGDKLVCLSTCEYTLGNGRLVVVGKRVS